MNSIEARLQRLEDEREILQTLYTYGHAYDYGWEDRFGDLWLEDALLTYVGRPPLQGRAAIVEFFAKYQKAGHPVHKHFLVEPRIVVSGDGATAESMYARLDRTERGPEVFSFGQYRDVLARCPDGRWRFRERQAEREAQRAAITAVK